MRVLIVRTGAMGDVLHALPAVAALRRARPEWWIGWAVEPRWGALLRDRDGRMPVVDRVFAANTGMWKRLGVSRETVGDVLELRRELRVERFDVCVDMQGTMRSAVIGRMAGAGRFVGVARPREGVARSLYGERVEVRAEHVVRQGCELLGSAVRVELAPGRVELPVDAACEAWAEAWGRGFVLLASTAGWGAKVWPAERYGALAAALGRTGLRVVVNAASGEDEVARRVAEASGGAAEKVVCGVGELVALTRRAGMVVGGDTGPVHLAAALEIPVVGIYGPTDPGRNGPFGERVRVLRDAGSRTDHARLVETEAGLLRIGVDEVVTAVREMLGE